MSSLRKVFPFFYAINLFACFLFPQLRIPGFPLNCQQVSQIVMLVLCFFMEKGRVYGDRFLLLYLVFYLFCALDSLTTGYFAQFSASILRVFFAVYSFYWSSILLIKYNNTIIPIIVPIIVIGTLDSVVTYFQLQGDHRLDFISIYLGTYDEDMVSYMETYGITYGRALNGIFRNPVFNGHNLLTFFTLSFLIVHKKFSPLWFAFPAIFLGGLFFCQQRSGFFLAIIFIVMIVVLLFRKGHLSFKFLFLLIIAAGLVLTTSIWDSFVSSVDGSRLTTIDFETRTGIFNHAIDYIASHPFGCEWQYHEETGSYSHNLILSAFIDAGWLGGCFLIALLCVQFSLVIKSFLRKGIEAAILGCAYLVVVADSMFHNVGIADGDGATWMVWGLFVGSYFYKTNSVFLES